MGHIKCHTRFEQMGPILTESSPISLTRGSEISAQKFKYVSLPKLQDKVNPFFFGFLEASP